MSDVNWLQDKQEVVYKILDNSMRNNKLAHAYMFSGVKGSLQLETAYLLAQSLVCDNDLWACGQCDNCLRIAHNTYPDFIVIDGTDKSIKKEDVLNLQSQFSMTAFEKSAYKIFIIKEAHKMTNSAANSLLKFLEEPSSNVIGILISDEITSILPTILSRCTQLDFKPLQSIDFKQLVTELNINERQAYYYSSVASKYIDKDDFINNESYLLFEDVFNKFIKTLTYDVDKSAYVLQAILLKHKDKAVVNEALNMFLDMLIVFFNDIIVAREVDDLYSNMLNKYRENFNYLAILAEVLNIKNKLVNNVNLPLLMDQLMFNIGEVMYE